MDASLCGRDVCLCPRAPGQPVGQLGARVLLDLMHGGLSWHTEACGGPVRGRVRARARTRAMSVEGPPLPLEARVERAAAEATGTAALAALEDADRYARKHAALGGRQAVHASLLQTRRGWPRGAAERGAAKRPKDLSADEAQ